VINLAAAVMERCCKDLGGAKVNLSKPQVSHRKERLWACAVHDLSKPRIQALAASPGQSPGL
jgi:hypothetical protein